MNITGTPRIVLNVDGNTRYATYTSGTGTASLTFTYSPTVGDVDLDGITISSTSIDLNGGTIKDLVGNDLSPATFTAPNTTGVKVNYPSLSMDFVYDADGRYSVNGVVYDTFPTFLSAVSGTFTGGSGTFYNSSGNIQTGTVGTPRFEYDPTTLQPKGLLLEGYTVNYALRSADINLSPWVVSNGTITANITTAPTGTAVAEKLVENAGTGDKEVSQAITVTNATVYTASIYAKAAERTQVRFRSSGGSSIFTLTGSGTAVSGGTDTASIQQINSGWYRLAVKFISSSTSETIAFALINGGVSSYAGDGTSGAYAWGAQLEIGQTPSSYIPTTTGTNNRALDNFQIPTGTWFSNTNGLMQTKTSTNNPTFNTYVYDIVTDNSNYMSLYKTASPISARFDVVNAGSTQASILQSASIGNIDTCVTSYKANSFKISRNGAAITSDTSGTAPSITSFKIGQSRFGVNQLHGNMRYFKYYPTQPSDTQLQLLSQ
ncbi:MAG: hypothetical protein A3B66_08660 [Alphaproteobacteria bacterium RIFCSPHIGHO2_02_FULL_46_13]|nr:MAG: hypothetical protein A3B66_08660 [Alphaproteobacteria bacterium RIFCSPHIGHO2_02_FULL_46_13]